jgi:hypothetical protein
MGRGKIVGERLDGGGKRSRSDVVPLTHSAPSSSL